MTSASKVRAYVLVCLLFCYSAFSQQGKPKLASRAETGFQYTTLQVPGATYTVAYGVNNNGDIVGSFVLNGVQSGFLYSGGAFQTIACPGVGYTIAQGINDNGVIVGWCGPFGAHRKAYGFICQDGNYSYVTYPNALITALLGINNQGEIVGTHNRGSFLYNNGTFTRIGGNKVSLSGINNAGIVAGTACTSTCQGVIYAKEKKKWQLQETVNYPGAASTALNGINDNGDLAGDWGPTQCGASEGFAYFKDTNTFVGFDIQNSADMEAQGINNSGEIVGFYTVGSTFYGFYGYVSQ